MEDIVGEYNNNINPYYKDNQSKNNKIHNLEILIRLYCFEKELKGKIKNYEKIKVDERIQTGVIMNKKLLDDYKKYFDYDNFVKTLEKTNTYKKIVKDKNMVFESKELDKNNLLFKIISELLKENSDYFLAINDKKINNELTNNKNVEINKYEEDKTKLYYIENFEIVNPKLCELISKQLAIADCGYFCRFIIGKEYFYFNIIIFSGDIPIISEIVKNNKDIFEVNYILNFNKNLATDFLNHLKLEGIEKLINYFKKNEKKKDYLFGNNSLNYYKMDKNKGKISIKQIKNESKKNEHLTHKDAKFKKNEILQKLIHLYCHYTDMHKKIYLDKNFHPFEKIYLINFKTFLDIKINLDYKILKDELESNPQIKNITEKNLQHIVNIDSIINLLPPNVIQDYLKKNINTDKNSQIEPNILPKNLQNQNESLMIYDEFELLDTISLNYFFGKIKNIKSIEAECSYREGKVFIHLPKYLNKNKYITLIGELDNDMKNFITSFVFVYNKEKEQKENIEDLMFTNFNKYLSSLKETFTPIQNQGKAIGTIIKLIPEEQPQNVIIPKKEERKKIGLQNIGATCYMNATLQCFVHIKEFVGYFKKEKKKINVISDSKTLSYSFKILIDNLWPEDTSKKETYYAPYEFKEKISNMNPLFQGIAANDSKDLINFIVMTLHEELNLLNDKVAVSNEIIDQTNKQAVFQEFTQDFFQRYNSLASELFYGINYNITRCTECQTQLYNYQIYFFIIFPLEEVRKFVCSNNNNMMNNQINQFNQFNQMQMNQMNQFNQMQMNQLNQMQINQMNQMNQFNQMNQNNNNINTVDINQCFEYDRRTCLMSGDNAMFCNVCQRSTNCNICTNLVYGPNILILILNRGKGKEFDVKLNFRENLDITKYVEEKSFECKYQLIGVITHLGEDGMSGHFIAFCKGPFTFKWYKFNDAIVSPVEDFKKEVIDFGMPYLLFYQIIK